MAEFFEILMLISFGFSWPFNLAKSIKTKSTKGKSPIFLGLIIFGYIAGIISKFVNPNFDMGSKWYVLFFYFLNLIMVAADLVAYFINKANESKKMEK